MKTILFRWLAKQRCSWHILCPFEENRFGINKLLLSLGEEFIEFPVRVELELRIGERIGVTIDALESAAVDFFVDGT
jgi:hypothetical protein